MISRLSLPFAYVPSDFNPNFLDWQPHFILFFQMKQKLCFWTKSERQGRGVPGNAPHAPIRRIPGGGRRPAPPQAGLAFCAGIKEAPQADGAGRGKANASYTAANRLRLVQGGGGPLTDIFPLSGVRSAYYVRLGKMYKTGEPLFPNFPNLEKSHNFSLHPAVPCCIMITAKFGNVTSNVSKLYPGSLY